MWGCDHDMDLYEQLLYHVVAACPHLPLRCALVCARYITHSSHHPSAAARWGHGTIWLNVRALNTSAIKLYTARGFQVVDQGNMLIGKWACMPWW